MREAPRAGWGPLAPADRVLLAGCALLAPAAVLAAGSPGARLAAAALGLAAVAAMLALSRAAGAAAAPWARFLLRLAGLVAGCSYLFHAAGRAQLLLHGRWLDDSILRLEELLFGTQPVLALQEIVSPWLTEWMMGTYLAYGVLYPLVGALAWRRGGAAGFEQYLLALALANSLCDVGFVLFPVAGPVPALGPELSVPLGGFALARAAEWVRAHLHFAGGCLPSIHCAAATAMWIEAFRSGRSAGLLLASVVLPLYAATVYGRFHYVSDVALGIAVGALSAGLAGRLTRARSGTP